MKSFISGSDRKKIVICTAIAVIALLALGCGIFRAGMAYGAGGAEPGSQGDPIVTLSYLNSRLASLEGNSGGGNAGQGTEGTQTGSSGGFARVELIKGQTLKLADGSLLTVYSGNGVVTVSGNGAGLMNLSGQELFGDGTSAVLYSVFMGVGEGSGIRANGSMTLYVSGDYELY